jgi:hypothetical protein
MRELKGLSVTFQGDQGSLPGKKWTIYEVALATKGNTTFTPEDRASISIFNYMNTTEFVGIVIGLHKKTNHIYRISSTPHYQHNVVGQSRKCRSPHDRWYPLDKLDLVGGQVVRSKLDNQFTQNMLATSERRPLLNQ